MSTENHSVVLITPTRHQHSDFITAGFSFRALDVYTQPTRSCYILQALA